MMFVTAITNTVFCYNWALPSPSFNLFENVRYQRNISIALGCLDIKLLFFRLCDSFSRVDVHLKIIHFIH